MEATDIESVGAAEIGEFTWKQLFDTDACTICGRCTSVCPANITGSTFVGSSGGGLVSMPLLQDITANIINCIMAYAEAGGGMAIRSR